MKITIEMFSTIIAITLACILFSSIISSNNQMATARDYYNVVVNRIEDSNCNQEVIDDCRDEADKRGYELKIEDMTVNEEQPSRLVILKYSITLPIFSLFGEELKKKSIIEGYAREYEENLYCGNNYGTIRSDSYGSYFCSSL